MPVSMIIVMKIKDRNNNPSPSVKAFTVFVCSGQPYTHSDSESNHESAFSTSWYTDLLCVVIIFPHGERQIKHASRYSGILNSENKHNIGSSGFWCILYLGLACSFNQYKARPGISKSGLGTTTD